jgi:hypothetical protein
MIAFPANPEVNDTYTASGRTWLWNGTAWQLQPRTLTSADIVDFSEAVGNTAPPTTDAALLTSGTLPDERLSAAVTASLALADTASQPGHEHTISEVTGLQTALDGKQASGNYATLVNGLVPADQLPSYVDDVLEFANLAAFPELGESGKIFVAHDTRKIYRWAQSALPNEIIVTDAGTATVNGIYTKGADQNQNAAWYKDNQTQIFSFGPFAGGSINKWQISGIPVSSGGSDYNIFYETAAIPLAAFFSPIGQSFISTSAGLDPAPTLTAVPSGSYIEISPSEVTSVAGKTGAVTLTKSDVGLENVANTAPADLPISTATQTALDGKVSIDPTFPEAGVATAAVALWDYSDGREGDFGSEALRINDRNVILAGVEHAAHPGNLPANFRAAIDSQIRTIYSDTPPAHTPGLEWVDTTDLRSYRSYNGLWVEIDRA